MTTKSSATTMTKAATAAKRTGSPEQSGSPLVALQNTRMFDRAGSGRRPHSKSVDIGHNGDRMLATYRN